MPLLPLRFCPDGFWITHRFLRRLPRPCRLWWKAITTLTNELGIHQTFSREVSNRFQESAFVVVFAFVKSERLLIQVPEKMKRFDRNVSPFDAALEQRPEVFQSIHVHMAFGVALRVIDNLMHIFVVELVVRAKLIGNNFRAFFHMLSDLAFQVMSANALDNFETHSRMFLGRVAFKQSHDRRFTNVPASGLAISFVFRAPVSVHVASLAADET